MRPMTKASYAELLTADKSTCISLYQATHRQHPDNTQDPIRFRNTLIELEKSLSEAHDVGKVREMMAPFEQLGRDADFWNYTSEGLAVFSSADRFEAFQLQRPVRQLLVVADSYHTKPLIRILQSTDRYQVLCLTRQSAKLYEGNRDALDPVDLTDVPTALTDVKILDRSVPDQPVGSYGTGLRQTWAGGTAVNHGHGSLADIKDADVKKFFHAVAQGIVEHHSRPSGLPLILVALSESQGDFRAVSDNRFLLEDGIIMDPASLDTDELRKLVWKTMEPHYLARLADLKDKFGVARSRQSGSGDLSDVAKAAVGNQVATLLIEADRVIPGVIDSSSGAIRTADLKNPQVDDMLDDLAELVIARGGEVVVVPKERMPTDTGLAAIYRY